MKTFESMDTLDVPFHHRILHNVRAHVQRHHRKYIFVGGMVTAMIAIFAFL